MDGPILIGGGLGHLGHPKTELLHFLLQHGWMGMGMGMGSWSLGLSKLLGWREAKMNGWVGERMDQQIGEQMVLLLGQEYCE